MRRLCWLLAPALALALGAPTPAADPPKADAEHIAQLIKQLGNDDFETREKATKELETIGTPALEALRGAAKSGEAEVKLRATSILEKVEKKAVAEKLLAPTKVKLTFKETPLADAVAEFNKKSGYTITVHDPEKKLKDRKVTLDTGEVTFWEAFDKFCEKAGVTEATWQDIVKPIAVPPGGGPGGIRPTPPRLAPPVPPVAGKAAPPVRVAPGFGGFAMPAGDIVVVDGKPKSAPTCYSGAVRIRALKDAPGIGLPIPGPGVAPAGKDDPHMVWLEVRAEPKLDLLKIQSVAVAKATDDVDQKLEKFTPPAAGGLPPGGFGGAAPGGPVARPGIAIGIGGGMGGMMGFGGGMMGFGGAQNTAVPLKKGEKEAKALKEFAGTISAMGMAPAEPVITVEKITKADGKTFKGKDSGQIKVVEVKEEDGKITIKFEMEMQQNAVGIGLPFGPVPVAPPPLPPPPPLPAKPAGGGFGLQVGGGGAPAAPPGVGPIGGVPTVRGFAPAPGVTLVDDKGKTIAQTGGAMPPKYEFVPGQGPKVVYTQEYKLAKDQKPAKLVYSASKSVTLDIPFSFKDVPLK